MSRSTVAGEATTRLLCMAFGVSRQALHASRRAPTTTEKVVRLSTRREAAPAARVLEGIRAVIAEQPAWGVRKVWAMLRREHALRVSRKRVWALMKAHGLVLAHDREAGEPTRGHVSVPEPDRRIATDFTTVRTRLDGVVTVAPTIDCGCRSVTGLTVTKSQEAPAVLASVEQSLEAQFGAPENVPPGVELRTDHGSVYTGFDCAALVAKWGLVHTFAPVGRPTGNAVAERFIRTMKEEVVWLRDWDTADQLREAIMAWLDTYNRRRAHQSLGWKTPAEYRAEKLGKPALKAA